ncbi:MAG: L-seryl-tRNA(Sec) selenium transferase [Chloroflexaceae bacterium]|nr:L-seryl-tRNA(Sec) selenium transferase [Chloroflexaceae bacterium]
MHQTDSDDTASAVPGYRDLPAVDRLIQQVKAQNDSETLPHDLLLWAARTELESVRAIIRSSQNADADDRSPPDISLTTLADAVQARLMRLLQPGLRPVINATGVIIQTNLGRAPLSQAALDAMHAMGTGYSNLEYNLEAGERGSRYVHLTGLLCRLTGAESAMVVNNNAAAIYLVLSALAQGREVIVSRGQAVEIGGGFRIPDVLRQSGATLVEVGTTNRTYAQDYAAAITDETAFLLRVHTSNFRLMGFVHETSLPELAAIGHAYEIPLLDDLGSGTLLATTPYGLAAEPTVQESIATGADLVTFSGDKLLGGPQAGLIVGRTDLLIRLRRHPLARALRVDKITIAGLEATLQSYLRGKAHEELPVWRMIAFTPESLYERANALHQRLQQHAIQAAIVSCESTIGGGSLPGATLPSLGLSLAPTPTLSVDTLAHMLRTGMPALVGRISEDRLLLDLRTVLPEQDELISLRLCEALAAPSHID